MASFIAELDHKPMEAIELIKIVSALPRMRRTISRLQPYDVTINYQPDRQMQVANALSKLSSEEAAPILDLTVKIHDVSPEFSSGYLQKIQAETAKDPELAALKVVYNGWPSTVREVPETKPSPSSQQCSDPRRSVYNKKWKEGEGTLKNGPLNKINTYRLMLLSH